MCQFENLKMREFEDVKMWHIIQRSLLLIMFLLSASIYAQGNKEFEYKTEAIFEIEISKDRRTITENGYRTLDSVLKILALDSFYCRLTGPGANTTHTSKDYAREYHIFSIIYNYLRKELSEYAIHLNPHHLFSNFENPSIRIHSSRFPALRQKD